MLVPNGYDEHVTSRLLDFFGDTTPWPRRLWDIGTILALKEVLEAGSAAVEGVLSDKALRDLCQTTEVVAGQDPGVGTKEEHRLLQGCLRTNLRPRSHDREVMEQLLAAVEPKYLENIANVLGTVEKPKPERIARAIAAHLLDAGFSPRYLHRWWTYRLKHEEAQKALVQMVLEAHELAMQPSTELDVLVVFTAAPHSNKEMPPEWRDATQVSTHLLEQEAEHRDIRQGGGLLLRVRARDQWAALERASEIVDGISARFSVGTKERLIAYEGAWIGGKRFPLRRPRRGVEVGSLERASKLYVVEPDSAVDAALELLSPLDEGPIGPAVSGAWAAIESLLLGAGDTGDRVLAADRLADLVACSLPRAELTALAYAHMKAGHDALGEQLAGCATNRDRARLLCDAIVGGAALALTNPSDLAARVRMAEMVGNPKLVVSDVRQHVVRVFHRVYRQRNLVLHWGRTTAVALRASLRTAAPLVGAGIDRVAHAWFVNQTTPLELAGRARIRIETLGTSTGRGIADLLEG